MDAAADSGGAKARWYVIHTRARHEKKVDGYLCGRGLSSFLPLQRVLSQWSDRKKWVEKPYFPGYLFVHVLRDDLADVLAAAGVVRLLGTSGESPDVVGEEEIENLRRLVAHEAKVDPYPYLQPGQAVRLKKGPLAGLEGVIVRKARKFYIVVSVHVIRQSIAVEVTADSVQPT